jgi:putative heme transporter
VRRLLSTVLVVVVVVGVLPQLADLSEALRLLAALEPRWLLATAVLAAGVLVTVWFALARLIGRVSVTQAGVAHLLSTCVANTVPAGGAVAVGVNLRVYGSYGRGPAPTTQGLLSVGVIDNAIKLTLPLFAAALGPVLPGGSGLPASVTVVTAAAAVGGLAVAIVLLRHETAVHRLATWLETVASRWRRAGGGSWGPIAVGYQRELRERLVQHGPAAAAGLLATHALQAALLVVALRAVGVPSSAVGVQTAVIAYALMRLVTALPVTPGGLGIAEVGLIGALGLAAGEATNDQLAAAVLLFRAATYLAPIVLAAPAWALWRVEVRRRGRGGGASPAGETPAGPPS